MIRVIQFLNSLTIQKAVLVATSLPIAAAIALAAWNAAGKLRAEIEYSEVERLVTLATQLSELVHEQQKERGATAVFLSSSGRLFGPELEKQRVDTDPRRDIVTQAIAEQFEEISAREPELAADLEKVLSMLAQMPGIRKQVDAASIPVKEAIAYYTGLNAQILTSIRDIARVSSDGDLTSAVISYVSFLQAKERAGIERAVGSSGFAAGKFSVAALVRLNVLIREQDVFYSIFLDDATPSQIARFDEVMASSVARRVDELREIANEGGLHGDLSGVTGPEFFDAQTGKIDLLKEIEGMVTDDLIAFAEVKRAAATRALVISALIALAAAVLGIAYSVFNARTLRHSMTAVEHAATTMAEGDLEIEMPPAPDTELGNITRALDQFRQSILAAREREAEAQKAERARAEEKHEAERRAQQAEDEAARAETARQQAEQARNQAVAEEIAAVVSACARGDFSQRLNEEDKEGVFAELCQGLNRISEETERSLNEIRLAVSALAEGDLGYRIPNAYEGVFGAITEAVNASMASLDGIVGSIRDSSETIRGSSESVTAAADDLARRTESNAATLAQTTAALSELAGSVRAVAESAGEASDFSASVRTEAEKGNELLTSSEAAMQAIRESSVAITKIISVIEDIAFQTNLLALNAGVEAARAGESGRGFAVVASEVRELASKSSDAAREISELISASSRKVEDGAELVENSGAALRSISEAVAEVAGRIDSIADATREQTTGLDEINTATSQLDRAIQENAAMFEQTNAALRVMDMEADGLMEAVGRFRHGADAARGAESGQPASA